MFATWSLAPTAPPLHNPVVGQQGRFGEDDGTPTTVTAQSPGGCDPPPAPSADRNGLEDPAQGLIAEALERRDVIGMAKGILMERYSLTPDEAFSYLQRLSSTSNTKLHKIAAHLVQETNHPASPEQRLQEPSGP